LGFFLTRSWVSEQNLNFLVPLVLLSSIGENWSKKWVTATWSLPLIFAVLHTLPQNMLFLTIPQSLIHDIQVQVQLLLTPEMGGTIRALITLMWLIVGLSLIGRSIRAIGLSLHARTPDSAAQNRPS
jgi:hypothetical protein